MTTTETRPIDLALAKLRIDAYLTVEQRAEIAHHYAGRIIDFGEDCLSDLDWDRIERVVAGDLVVDKRVRFMDLVDASGRFREFEGDPAGYAANCGAYGAEGQAILAESMHGAVTDAMCALLGTRR